MKLVLVSLALSGCVSFDDPMEPPIASTSADIERCPIIICGENAATAGDGLLFDELDLFGRANYAGVSLLGANLASGNPAKIDIQGDHLYAYDLTTGVRYESAALINMQIHFRHVSGERFDLLLVDVNEKVVTYQSGAREIVPVYAFWARRSGHTQFDFAICNNDSMPARTWDGLDHYALLYRGDRYVPMAKALMSNNPTDGWSFLACNGSAATKMHLWRHTFAGAFDATGVARYMTNLGDRTALLKGITADYCGTGGPAFTVTGTPLVFATTAEPTAFPFPARTITSVEAEWTATGVVCLDHPRHEADGITRTYVQSVCGRSIPQCGPVYDADGSPHAWTSVSHVVTANPTLPLP